LLAMGAKIAEVTVTHRGAAAVCVVGVLLLKMKFRYFHTPETNFGRSWWLRGLRRGSAAARLLELRVEIPPGAMISVFCERCVLSGRGLCDGLITRPEGSYRLWCV
jgi:hypothetical protein